MKRLLQLTLWLSLFTILGGVTNSYAQEVKWTALEVTNEQVDSDKVSDAKEESVKVGFSLYNAGKITVTDKETQKEIEITGNACNVVVGHTIIINGEGQDGMKFVKGSFAKPYQSPSFFEQLPMEITVPKEGLKIMLRFGHIIEFGVRGEGGKITAQKTEEEDDEWGDTDEFTSDINSGDSFNVGDVTKVTFHATPNEGYLIKAWYLNGEIQQGRENSFTLKNPQKSFKVEVEFEENKPQEETVKVGFSLYNAGKITVTDKETQKEIEIAGNACNVVVGHTIIINGEGQDGMKFVKGSFAKPYQSPSFFEQLPMEIAVPKEGLNIMLRFSHIIEFGVRGEGGEITAQKTEEEIDDFGDTEEVSSKINSGDSFNARDVTKVTFHATPNEGYLIKAWYLNGELQQGRENSFTVKNPQKSFKVEVEFAKPILKTTKVKVTLKGIKKFIIKDKETDKDLVYKMGAYDAVIGHTLVIDAIGKEGLEFAQGSYKIGYGQNILIDKLPAEIKVADQQMIFNITFSTILKYEVKGEGGKVAAYIVEGKKEKSIESGKAFSSTFTDAIHVIATPDHGYQVKAWYLNGKPQPEQTGNDFIVKNPDKSLKVEVEFEAVPIKHFAVSLTATPMKGAKELWIAQAANKNNNFVKVEGLSSELEEGMSVEFNINVNDGYAFDGFYIGSDKQVSEGDQSKGFRLVIDRLDKAINVIAKMNAIITFAVEGDKNGSLTAQIDDKSIKSGSGIESGKSILLTATPNDKFIIKRWIVDGKDLTLEDGSLNTDQTINLTMGEDPKDVKVEFMIAPKKKYQIAATTSDEELGSFSIFDITSGNKNEVANESSLEEGTELLFVLDLEDNVKVDTVTINNQKGINLDEKMSFKINLNDTNCKEGKLIVFAKLINTESTSAVMNTTKVYAIENEVYIETTTSTSYQIFTIGGKKIKQGIANTHDSFRLNSGAYIVVIDNKVFKLLVK